MGNLQDRIDDGYIANVSDEEIIWDVECRGEITLNSSRRDVARDSTVEKREGIIKVVVPEVPS